MTTTTFPRWKGDGEGAFVWGLVQALHRRGVYVRVVALHSPGTATHEVIDGIEIVRPRYWRPERHEYLRREGGGLPITLRRYWLARLQLLPFSVIQGIYLARCATDCQVLHAHWTLSGALGLFGRWYHQCPVVVTVQGSDVFQVTQYPGGAWLTRLILNRCDRITALTHSLKESAVKAGISAEKLDIIPNGVHSAEFTPSISDTGENRTRREPLILFVGSLIERKGATYLLDALPMVLSAFPSVRAVLIGTGPEEAKLRQQTKTLGIAHCVDFLGFLPQAEIQVWMRRARLFALPSLEEGQGVVLIEALASGTPVVASDVDGIKEVITPEVGQLVAPRDPAALATALKTLLGEEELWSQMSHDARLRAVCYYDWDLIAQRYITLYESLL